MIEKNKRGKSSNLALFIALISLGVVFSIIAFQTQTTTGKIIYTSEDCSLDNISAIWDSVFVEDSIRIGIVNNSDCSRWYAYKINGDQLHLIHNQVIFGKGIIAIEGSFNTTFLDTVAEENLDNIVPPEFSIDTSFSVNAYQRVPSENDPETEFARVFDVDTGDWEEGIDALNDTYLVHVFTNVTNEETPAGNITNTSNGIVHANLTLNYYIFITISECTPNWTEQTTTCNNNETQTTYFIDENSCGETPAANETTDCDKEGDSIIGNISDITLSSGINFQMEINNSEWNNTVNYTDKGKLNIEMFDGSNKIMEFEWDFDSDVLNLKKISIEKQSSGSEFGYIIIEGIDEEKEVRFDKKITSSNAVCIKDAIVGDIDELSNACDESNEYLIDCDGTADSGYTCEVAGTSRLIVTGVEHSAIKETTKNETDDDSCSPDWDCTNWTACSGGLKLRVCEDENDCGTTTGKPLEEESCSSGSSCTPDWTCGEWKPVECPKEGEKTRNCTDGNSCGVETNKPTTAQKCTYKGDGTSTIIWIMVIIFIALMGVVSFLIYRSKSTASSDTDKGFGSNTNMPRPGMPPRPGAGLAMRPPMIPPSPPGRANPGLARGINPNSMPPQKTFRPGQ